MLKFLAGPDIGQYLKEQSKLASRIDAAVAFWGAGAAKALGLDGHHQVVRVICDLGSGATNPSEISRLLAQHPRVEVRQLDGLHAKVYVFDAKLAVVGSANASSNGLGLEGIEVGGQVEACVATDDGPTLKETKKWFKKQWKRSRRIDSADIEAAQAIWRRRRKARPRRAADFTELVRTADPGLAERSIYILLYEGGFSPEGQVAFDRKKEELDEPELGGFEDWGEGLPLDATLIAFECGPKGRVTFDGVYWTRDTREIVQVEGGGQLDLCRVGWHSLDTGFSLSRRRAIAWTHAVKALRAELGAAWAGGHDRPIEDFARRFGTLIGGGRT